jgi:hypothetical protein
VAKMTNIKFKADIPFMARIKVGAIRALQDPQTGKLYYDMCEECEQLLDEDEFGYGHECQ